MTHWNDKGYKKICKKWSPICVHPNMGTTKACGSHCNSGPLCCLMHLRYTTLLLVCLPFCPLQFTTSLCPLRSDLRDGTFSLKRVDPSFNTWVFSSDPLCKSFGVKSLPFEAKKTYSYLNPLVYYFNHGNTGHP